MEDYTIGQRIAAKRKALGLSQIALGEQMGVSRQSISKWEADAALPEIDKLIALSKLFGVSVGWLLGVEESPEQSQEAETEFTDREWEIIDQLTQTEPKLPKWLVPLTAVTAAAALIALVLAGAAFHTTRSSREALTAMSQSIAMMAAGAENGMTDATVLDDYQFLLEPSGDLQSCTLHFTGTPPIHTAGSVGELLIFADGQQIASAPCQWNGAAYAGSVTLDVRDGYSTLFTVTTPSGIVRSTVVHDYAVNRMDSATAFDQLSVDYADYTYQDGVLTLNGLYFIITPPELLRDVDDLWQSCDLVVMANRQELGRIDIMNRSKYSKRINFSEKNVNFLTQSQSIEIGDLSGYRQVTLILECKLSTGMDIQSTIKTWAVNNGSI